MKLFLQLHGAVVRGVNAVENSHYPFINYFLGFIFVLVIAFFINGYSQPENIFNLPASQLATNLVHFLLAFVTLALLLIVMLSYLTQLPVSKLLRTVMTCFVLIWVKPLIDLLVTNNVTNTMYLQPGVTVNEVADFILTGAPIATLGTKCLVIIFLGSLITYFRIKNTRWLHSILYTVLIYLALILWSASPFFINAIMTVTGYDYVFSVEMMIHFYLIALFMLGVMVARFANPALFSIFIRDIRALRMMHYESMIILGVAIALAYSAYDIGQQLRFSADIIINTLLCMIGLLFSGLFAIVINNLSDVDIDKISNTNRPLIRNEIDASSYTLYGYAFMGIALFYSAMVNAKALLAMSIFMGAYYVYSSPPLRLKRMTVLSKLAISLNSLALVMLGYLLVQQSIAGFPGVLYGWFLIGFTLSANFIDLKDMQGDRSAGVITLPLLLGEGKAKLIIGCAFWATYMAIYFLVKNVYLLPLLFVGGGLQFYLINRKPYNECWVLWFHNLSVMTLIIYLLVMKSYFS